jgi:PEGA domain-containing protein
MRFRKGLLAGLTLMVAMVVLPQIGAAQRIVVRPYGYYGYYGAGWGPTLYQPYYYYPRVVVAAPRVGAVKIQTHLKDASVYVDGGFVGRTGKLKNVSLQPGNHNVEVRDVAGRMLFNDRVNVLAGRTVEIKL